MCTLRIYYGAYKIYYGADNADVIFLRQMYRLECSKEIQFGGPISGLSRV